MQDGQILAPPAIPISIRYIATAGTTHRRWLLPVRPILARVALIGNASIFQGHAQPPVVRPAATGPVRLPSTIVAGMMVQKTIPAYPIIAKETRTEGVVILQATISTSGTIENLRVDQRPPDAAPGRARRGEQLALSALPAEWTASRSRDHGQCCFQTDPVNASLDVESAAERDRASRFAPPQVLRGGANVGCSSGTTLGRDCWRRPGAIGDNRSCHGRTFSPHFSQDRRGVSVATAASRSFSQGNRQRRVHRLQQARRHPGLRLESGVPRN